MKIQKTSIIKLISCFFLLYFSIPAQADINNPFCCNNGFYLGVFGGGGAVSSGNATQQGSAFFPASQGGTLVVNAYGDSNNPSAWFGGAHLGLRGNPWQLGCGCGLGLIPAIEVEALYLKSDPDFQVVDTTNRLLNHRFDDSFSMRTGVFLANVVAGFQFPNLCIYPYVGVGLGTARIKLDDADSLQVLPAEPGVNHFNSDPDASDNAFAAQAKIGINYDLSCHFKVFAEYRYLYFASTDYTFGSTQYPTHVQTTNWTVHLGKQHNNLFDVGVDYAF